MTKAIKKIGAILVFIAVFASVKYGIQQYHAHNAITDIENNLTQVKRDAVAKRPDVVESEALRQEFVEITTKKLNSESDPKRKLKTAAANFYGFYLINVRGRAEYCREYGVDISPFVSEFARIHVNELARAEKISSDESITAEGLYVSLQPQMRKMLAQDMKDVGLQWNVSQQEACKLIAQNGEALANEMHISKSQPVVFQALNGG